MPSRINSMEPAFGTQEERRKFLDHLVKEMRFTQQDISQKSRYGIDTVKAWFSENEARRRAIPDRAMALLLQSTNTSEEAFRQIIGR